MRRVTVTIGTLVVDEGSRLTPLDVAEWIRLAAETELRRRDAPRLAPGPVIDTVAVTAAMPLTAPVVGHAVGPVVARGIPGRGRP